MYETIFDNVVTKENAFTELFCNALKLDKDFRSIVLHKILGNELARKVQTDEISTQYSLGDGYGQPDIKIENNDNLILIEVKIDVSTPLTNYQRREYFNYLDGLQKAGDERKFKLILLAPEDYWLPDEWNQLKNESSSIEVKDLSWWSDLGVLLKQHQKSREDIHDNHVINHVIGLIRQWWEPVTMNLKDLKSLEKLSSAGSSATLSKNPIQQLYSLIEATAKTLNSSGYKTSFSRNQWNYGTTIRDSEDNNLLWFGTWYQLWDMQTVLCHAFPSVGWGDNRLTAKIYRNTCGKDVKEVHDLDDNRTKWLFCSLPKQTGNHLIEAQELALDLSAVLKELETNFPSTKPIP